MDKYWDNLERYFYDCELDTYFNLIRYYNVEVCKEEFFIFAQMVDENCEVFQLNMKGLVLNCPAIFRRKYYYLDKLCDNLKIQKDNHSFESINQEINFIKKSVNQRNPVIVEIVSNYEGEKPTAKVNGKFGTISVASIVGYNESEFLLGIKNLKTNDLSTITIENYTKARDFEHIPIPPKKEISTLVPREKYESKPEIFEKLLLEQLSYLKKQDQISVLIQELNKNISGNRIMSNVQLKILRTTMVMGSKSGFYYELSKAAQYCELPKTIITELEHLSFLWKKIVRCIDHYLSNSTIIFTHKMRKELIELIMELDKEKKAMFSQVEKRF